MSISGAAADSKVVGDEIAGLKADLRELEYVSDNLQTVNDKTKILKTGMDLAEVYITHNRPAPTSAGVIWIDDDNFTINGTPTSGSNPVLYMNLVGTTSSVSVGKGETYSIKLETDIDTTDIFVAIYVKHADDTVESLTGHRELTYKVLFDDKGLIFRVGLKTQVHITATCKVTIVKNITPLVTDPEVSPTGIVQRLAAFNMCILGDGVYTIPNTITMPVNSLLKGYSKGAILRYTGNSTCIRMSDRCTVENLTIQGSDTDITLPTVDNVGDKHAIEWTGDSVQYGTVDACVLERFTGSGIYAHDTSTPVDRNLFMSNCAIRNCCIGVYIRKNSEFIKIVNCEIARNTIGVLNRGGNNVLNGCGIDGNVVNVQIDNDEGTNGGHGIISGCSLNHANNNVGYSLIIKGTGRMIVTNCNIYYGKTLLQNTNGNIIAHCGFGNASDWEVAGGNCSVFMGCTIIDLESTPITISNSPATRIIDCHTRNGYLVVYDRKTNSTFLLNGYSYDYTAEITNLENVARKITQDKIYPIIAGSGYFINYENGNIMASEGRSYTDFVDVGTYTKIIYRKITTTASTGLVGMAWYDKKRQYISGIRLERQYASNGYIDSEVEVPENAYYARFSTFTDTNTYGEFYFQPKTLIEEVVALTTSNEIKTYNNFKSGYIDTSNNKIDLSNPVQAENFCYMVIPCEKGETLSPNTLGGNTGRVRCVFCDSQDNILWKSGTAAEASTAPANRYIRWLYTAPAGTSYAVINHHIVPEAGFSPIVYKCYSDEKLNLYASKKGEIPYLPAEDWRRCVIATYNNYIAIKMAGSIRISDDCGKTWSNDIYAENIGSINNAHFYTNGTLAFFTDTKAYYIADKATINEANVFEADGVTPFTLDTDSNFNAGRDHAERKFISGNDIYVFNNYHMVAGTGRPIVWYSIDGGRTYKVACEFNIPDTFMVRHLHDVIYWEEYDKFILTTGDHNDSECYVFELTYDVNHDTWSVQKLAGSSRDYKWAGMALWNNELYYTHDSTPGSVWKCSYENIADLTKHVCVLDYTENDSNNVCFGANGDMIVTQSTSRSTGGATVPTPYTQYEACRKAYYSTNGKNFDALFLPNEFFNRSSLLRSPKPLTSDGHLYFSSFYGDDGLPSVCVDDYVRIYLNKQAFKPKI